MDLEIKRTSITRLKPAKIDFGKTFRVAWNQKNLDYEIETSIPAEVRTSSLPSWNQKNLDYEIETKIEASKWRAALDLKSKEPRLRDWNANIYI